MSYVLDMLSACGFCIRLTEGQYDEVADETLESLADKFDALVEDGLTLQDYDVQQAVGDISDKVQSCQ